MPLPLEMCTRCDSETGRAGIFDDSICIELSDGESCGPFCEDCEKEITEKMKKIILSEPGDKS